MLDKKKEKKRLFIQLYIIGGILTFFIVLLILRQFENICEFWSKTYYRFFQSFFGPLVSWIPFSITEFFLLAVIGVIIWLVVLIIRNLIRKNGLRSANHGLTIAIILVATATFYFSTAGMAYGRAQVDIPQYDGEVEYTQYVDVIEHFRDDFNYCSSQLEYNAEGGVISPYSINEINTLLEDEYAKIDSDYFTPFTAHVKPLLSSFIFTEFNIVGISFAPTTEPMINTMTPASQLASAMAHEIAHSKGVMREEDANLVAMYVCLNSDIPYLRYSGYFTTFGSLLNLSRYVGDPDKHDELYNTLNTAIRHDYTYYGNYWKKHNLLANMGRWFNDMYLKIVGTKGVDS
ncbi:MAG: DUF3810 family protein [Firmicutes bacterium]|nr:DUF3810 family protein [Bacillota bacterium]